MKNMKKGIIALILLSCSSLVLANDNYGVSFKCSDYNKQSILISDIKKEASKNNLTNFINISNNTDNVRFFIDRKNLKNIETLKFIQISILMMKKFIYLQQKKKYQLHLKKKF